MSLISTLGLALLGFGVGTFGTLIGAGGGFILVPILLMLYPGETPEFLTSVSLAVVFFNALSGSVAYARKGRIDYRSGLMFAAATVPGALLGAYSIAYIPRHVFNLVFGVLLFTGATYLFFRARRGVGARNAPADGRLTRVLVEADGTRHEYAYNPQVGVGLSTFVGYVSSMLGIGGGIVHVPAMTYLLGFPVHVATATSHFTLAFMALAATVVHLATGVLQHGLHLTLLLTLGVLAGAQVGARLSDRMKGSWIIQALAVALGLVGLRILLLSA